MVGGDANWDDAMARWIGRAARVTRPGGVDAQGCPGVRVDVDGGQYFWRVRDLGIGTGPQPRPAPRPPPSPSAVPQECHQAEGRERYGAVVPGARVVLGRHRPVDGDDNWADDMMAYVGRTATVVRAGGLDGGGCPGVHVDIDGGQWFWRIRDVQIAGAGGTGPTAPYVASTGVSTDHGRPATVAAWAGGGGGSGVFGSGAITPQACGMADGAIDWGPIVIGTEVILGRHRDVNGDANWSDAMEQWVGQRTRVAHLEGVDDQGCPVVRVQIDASQYYWRVRDMTLP
jgi:hypothetical protein